MGEREVEEYCRLGQLRRQCCQFRRTREVWPARRGWRIRAGAGAAPEEVATWDMHATATPGDWTELQNVVSVFPNTTRLTARKGSCGHGMSVCGGWELTAQHMGFAKGILHPIDLEEGEIHPQMRPHHGSLVRREKSELEGSYAGKINMGVGGVNACVIGRPWDEPEE